MALSPPKWLRFVTGLSSQGDGRGTSLTQTLPLRAVKYARLILTDPTIPCRAGDRHGSGIQGQFRIAVRCAVAGKVDADVGASSGWGTSGWLRCRHGDGAVC